MAAMPSTHCTRTKPPEGSSPAQPEAKIEAATASRNAVRSRRRVVREVSMNWWFLSGRRPRVGCRRGGRYERGASDSDGMAPAWPFIRWWFGRAGGIPVVGGPDHPPAHERTSSNRLPVMPNS